MQIPKEERWPITVTMMAILVRTLAPRPSNSINLVSPDVPMGPFEFSAIFKTFLRTEIQQILLREDLEAYGRKAARRNNVQKSPFALIKVWICVTWCLALETDGQVDLGPHRSETRSFPRILLTTPLS